MMGVVLETGIVRLLCLYRVKGDCDEADEEEGNGGDYDYHDLKRKADLVCRDLMAGKTRGRLEGMECWRIWLEVILLMDPRIPTAKLGPAGPASRG
jgi:hypothetical protein